MPVSFPLLVIRCEVGDPSAPRPRNASYRSMFGPARRGGILAFWEDATYGYFDFRGSVISPIYDIATADVVGDRYTDDNGREAYGFPRDKIGARAIALAAADGIDTGRFSGFVVLYRRPANLRFEGLPVDGFSGGAYGPAGGPKVAVLNVEATHRLMAHEVGHVLLLDHSWGLESGAYGWNDPPFNRTREYGDPFCIMSAQSFGGLDPSYEETSPPAADWPSETFAAVGPAPSLATLRHYTHGAAALRDNGAVRWYSRDEWRGGVVGVRLHAADDATPGRTKLVVLEGGNSLVDLYLLDGVGTFYLEYRRDQGWDRGLGFDPAYQSIPSPGVVIHELQQTYSCLPDGDETEGLPRCRKGTGRGARTGRRRDDGLQVHFRARIPTPGEGVSRDWRGGDAPYVRVAAVAPDGAWVDVVIDPRARDDERSVLLTRVEYEESARRTVYSGRESISVVCLPRGRKYGFAVDEVSRTVTLAAEVRGYGGGTGPSGSDVVLTWSINGAALPAVQPGEAVRTGRISAQADVRRFQRSREPVAVANATVTIDYEVHPDGRLMLRNVPSDGNYDIAVGLAAAQSDGVASSERRVERQVILRGQEVVWDDAYRREIGGCLDQLADTLRGTIIRRSPPIRRIRWPEPEPPSPLLSTARLDRAAAAYQQLAATDPAKGRELARLVSLLYGVDIDLTR